MSHYKEREEKVCLNCNVPIHGRFCHQCGQENREPRVSAWSLVTHFFSDITHFDGKFFSTTRLLMARPGLLPRDFINGRRARYLDPIRMYIFSSAIFFLIFISLYGLDHLDESVSTKKVSTIMTTTREELLRNAASAEDTLLVEQQIAQTDSILRVKLLGEDPDNMGKDSASGRNKQADRILSIAGSESRFKTRAEYDSAQASLPPEKRDGWFKRRIEYRAIDLSNRMRKDESKFWDDVVYKFVHSLPYLLFISLPLYALWLKLLYIRRQQFYYVDHGIFLIYLYIYTFIFLMIAMGVHQLAEWLEWDILYYILVGMFCWGIYYAWRAMHKFYGQGKFKTTIKFLLFNFLGFVSLIVLFILLFALTIFSV